MSEFGQQFAAAVKEILDTQYGNIIAPPAYYFSTGIRTLDAQLGGGIYSSHLTHITATPETGKSTFVMQMAQRFLSLFPDSIFLYLDVETVGGYDEQTGRWRSFVLDPNRFIHKSVAANIRELFSMINTVCQIKRTVQERAQESGEEKDIRVAVCIDSIASVPGLQDQDAESPDQVIGRRAREITHFFRQYSCTIKMEQLVLFTIDQVRQQIQMQSRFQATPEKSVGEFKGFRAATKVAYLEHAVSHWLHFSKGVEINPASKIKYPGVDGWVLHIRTEKNKHAPSGVTLEYIFDKRYGIHPFWSEYHFLKEWTTTEKKYYGDSNPHFDLCIRKAGAYKKLVALDKDGTVLDEITFREADAYNLYQTDSKFKEAFDIALQASIEMRIRNALFAIADSLNDTNKTEDTNGSEESS